jgi:hypothetical protein
MTEKTALLRALIEGPTDVAEERSALALLRGATTAELNEMIVGNEMHRLFGSLDNRLVGPDHRSELIQLLARDRRRELSVMSAAGVIYALQRGRTGREDETAIRDMLLATHGEELTRLKNQINARADIHDLEGLVFSGIDDAELRREILDHIAAEAATLHVDEAKILSDLDDTAFCRLHDRRYPKGTLYPGLLALYDALDAGPHDDPFSVGDLTFVTARPTDAFGLIESATRGSLRRAGIAQSSVITGSFLTLLSHDLMAGKKLANVEHYHALYPEYDLVFLGDSGQGDVILSEQLWKRFPGTLRAAFIHDVVDTPEEERARYAAEQIFFHDTYAGCALKAHELGLISRAGLDRVVAETRAGLDAIEWDSPEQERRIRDLVDRDAAAAGR